MALGAVARDWDLRRDLDRRLHDLGIITVSGGKQGVIALEYSPVVIGRLAEARVGPGKDGVIPSGDDNGLNETGSAGDEVDGGGLEGHHNGAPGAETQFLVRLRGHQG